MKRLTYLAVLFAFIATSICITADNAAAADKKPEKPKKEQAPKAPKAKPELKELTVNGKIEKVVKPGKDGKPDKITYVIVAESGQKIMLPQTKIDVESLVDANVTMTAKGITTMKGDKESIAVKEVLTIEKAADDGAAPAAEVEADVVPADNGPADEDME